ncbi:MAG: hypothetical protein E3J21_04025 [Anaerolineales bacterium]|nr:MAG: hypothetical protein E3J21_04025 [Anaerolineales bacterium]
MKKTVISIVAVLVIIAVVAGSFWAGMSFGQARANQGRERFRGPGGQVPGLFGTPQPGQRGAERFAGGIMGTIEAVEGDTLIVTTQEGDISVQTTDTTMIEKYTTVAISDLGAGERVVVSGTRHDDGSYTARSIRVLQILPASQSQ